MLGPLLAQLAWEFDTSVAITGQLASATFNETDRHGAN
jgi:hypothetical protein